MSWSEEDLDRANQFAQLLLSDEELALIMEVEPVEIRVALSEPGSPLGSAIRNGRLKTKAELHRSQIDLALRGSSPAQTAVEQLIKALG